MDAAADKLVRDAVIWTPCVKHRKATASDALFSNAFSTHSLCP